MIRNTLLIAAAILCLNGCTTLAPNYVRPAAPTPALWPSGPAYKDGALKPDDQAAADIAWREFIISEQLRKVTALALVNNRDLRVAALSIEKTRALYQIQRAELFPAVNASGIGSEQRLPAGVSGTGRAMTVGQYGVNLGFSSYELDFFGRIRSLKDRALEQFLATEQARRSTQISLVAEVANTYLILAADRERLKLAQATLETQQATYKLIRRRYEVGASSELDLRQAQTRVDAARVDTLRYIGQAAQDENALTLLVGSPVPAELL
ncbi:MAG: TolC family protein, partial [Sulfuricaulis sp.]|nr:TolC family protein [Sulfuricaulis sp.]